MTLLDAYGLVALAADETGADEVEALLRAGDCAVVSINLAEAVDVCRRTRGLLESEVRGALEPLVLSRTLVVGAPGELEAWLAADLRVKHYHRTERPLSIADCFLLAHALKSGDSLATSDPSVAVVARDEGATLIALPDSSGRRP